MKKAFVPSLILFIFSQIILLCLAVINLNGSKARWFVSGPMAHFTWFFVSAFLLVFTLKQGEFKNPYTLSIIYCILAAVFVEFIQLAIPYRTFGFDDIAFSVLGGVSFVVLGHGSEHGYRHIKHRIMKYREEKNKKI